MSAKFAVGTIVHTREPRPVGHTRLPAYLAHKSGEVIRVSGPFAFPEDIVDGVKPPRHEILYTVRFAVQDLWTNATGNDLYVDLYETYLEGREC